MFSTRALSSFFLFASLSISALASPIAIAKVGAGIHDNALAGVKIAARSPLVAGAGVNALGVAHVGVYAGSDLVGRSADCGCDGHDDAVLGALVDLKAKVDIRVALLDGVHAPIEHIHAIIADVNDTVKVLVSLNIKVGITGDKVVEIVKTIVYILVSIVGAVSKYSLWVVASILAELDAVLCLLVKTVVSLVPGILELIVKAIANIDIFVSLKLVLTIAALGLKL